MFSFRIIFLKTEWDFEGWTVEGIGKKLKIIIKEKNILLQNGAKFDSLTSY